MAVSNSLVARCSPFLVFWCWKNGEAPRIWETKNLKQRQQQTIRSLPSPCSLKKPAVKTTTSATKEWETQNIQSRCRTGSD